MPLQICKVYGIPKLMRLNALNPINLICLILNYVISLIPIDVISNIITLDKRKMPAIFNQLNSSVHLAMACNVLVH